MPYATHENNVQYLADDGTVLGEVTFPSCGDGIVDINHTFVDGCCAGRASRASCSPCSSRAREERAARHPSCSYAVRWFEKHAEYAHLLAE